MAKLDKSWYTLGNEEKERYKYLNMLGLSRKSLGELEGKDAIMKEYEETVSKLNKDAKFRMHVTEEEDEMLVYNSSIELAEERGMEKGSKQKAIETAKKMLNNDVSIEDISKYTELSIEEINSLK